MNQLPETAIPISTQPMDQLIDAWAAAAKKRLAQRAAHEAHTAIGCDGPRWDVHRLTNGLMNSLHRQDMLELAINAMLMHSQNLQFDHHQMRRLMPAQAVAVANQMHQIAAQQDGEGGLRVSAQQLTDWACQIDRADGPSISELQVAAAPDMYAALMADSHAAQATTRHLQLQQQARSEGWFHDRAHPGHADIRRAAEDRWDKEVLAFDLKRQALLLATNNATSDSDSKKASDANTAGVSILESTT